MATRPLREIVRREGDQEILSCGHTQTAYRRRAIRRRCRACAEASLPSRYAIVRVADDSEAVCPYCKDTMAGAQAVTCSGCRAQLCALCVAEVSACPVFGCRRPFVARGGMVPITAKPRVTVTVPAVAARIQTAAVSEESILPPDALWMARWPFALIGPRGMGILVTGLVTIVLGFFVVFEPLLLWLWLSVWMGLVVVVDELRRGNMSEPSTLSRDLRNVGDLVGIFFLGSDIWRRYHQRLDASAASSPPPVDPELPWRRESGTTNDRA